MQTHEKHNYFFDDFNFSPSPSLASLPPQKEKKEKGKKKNSISERLTPCLTEGPIRGETIACERSLKPARARPIGDGCWPGGERGGGGKEEEKGVLRYRRWDFTKQI